MNTSLSTTLVILMAFFFANLPFINDRVLGLIPLQSTFQKPFWIRLLELMFLYFVVGGLGFYLESSVGNRFEQNWEFYAITVCLLIVFAFPGFVYRYLRKKSVH